MEQDFEGNYVHQNMHCNDYIATIFFFCMYTFYIVDEKSAEFHIKGKDICKMHFTIVSSPFK